MLINFQHKKVLVAPLDWGLGHATRCIPIIYELLQNKNEVWIAADGAIEVLLKSEFPQLKFIKLFNYNIQYSTNGNWLWVKMLQQSKHLLKCIKNENIWLNKFISSEKIDIVISDNRYGLYHPSVHSVFITHQLKLSIDKPFGFFEHLTKYIFEKYIKQFDECWIPDYADANNNLSGKLSHSNSALKNLKFIEPLSRFKNFVPQKSNVESDILILISGPEPQRTIWEQKIINQLFEVKLNHQKVIIVGGIFNDNSIQKQLPNNVEYHSSIAATELYYYLAGAKKIICRSGYSTVMDLEALNKKVIFIPTPGQTEQEYLARWLHKKGFGIFISQKNFQLKNFIE
ncbi:MAG: hypothetical protein RIQ33_489 [Bacteroidota bacterium]